MRTIVDGIRAGAGRTGTLAVLGGDGGIAASLPWSGVHERASRMAAHLAGAGIGRGCRVALLGDTSVDLVAAIQAVWLAGAAVTVLPPPTRGGANLRAIVADARPDLAVSADLAVSSNVWAAGTGVRVMALAELAAAGPTGPGADPAGPEPGDLAVLQYTSGSTRNPRGIPVTHAHLAANIAAIRAATDHEAIHPGRTFSWLPLYHDMGLIGFLTLPMACGCPLLLQSPAAFARRPAGWLEALSRYRITASGGPNFAYGLMAGPLAAGLDIALDSVRFLLTGGEPVDAATMARFAGAAARYGLDPRSITPGYGLAESTLAVTCPAPGLGARLDRVDPHALEHAGRAEPATHGRPLVRLGGPVPGTEVRITRAGRPLGPRLVGQIEVRGASVVGHYWGEAAPAPGRLAAHRRSRLPGRRRTRGLRPGEGRALRGRAQHLPAGRRGGRGRGAGCAAGWRRRLRRGGAGRRPAHPRGRGPGRRPGGGTPGGRRGRAQRGRVEAVRRPHPAGRPPATHLVGQAAPRRSPPALPVR